MDFGKIIEELEKEERIEQLEKRVAELEGLVEEQKDELIGSQENLESLYSGVKELLSSPEANKKKRIYTLDLVVNTQGIIDVMINDGVPIWYMDRVLNTVKKIILHHTHVQNLDSRD